MSIDIDVLFLAVTAYSVLGLGVCVWFLTQLIFILKELKSLKERVKLLGGEGDYP